MCYILEILVTFNEARELHLNQQHFGKGGHIFHLEIYLFSSQKQVFVPSYGKGCKIVKTFYIRKLELQL